MGELTKLPNVGRVLEKNLHTIGIYTEEQLRKTGCKEAFSRIKMIDPGACLNMLYGLQGAIDGVKACFLPESTKSDLKVFFKNFK